VENVYQDKISKKDEELDELRHSLDELLAKPPVEKIVEVIVEKPIVDEKQKLLQQTLQNLRGQLNLKDEEIKKLKEDIEYLKGEIDKPATFLRTSNLKDNIY
jgi:chromosome segregation ATPase